MRLVERAMLVRAAAHRGEVQTAEAAVHLPADGEDDAVRVDVDVPGANALGIIVVAPALVRLGRMMGEEQGHAPAFGSAEAPAIAATDASDETADALHRPPDGCAVGRHHGGTLAGPSKSPGDGHALVGREAEVTVGQCMRSPVQRLDDALPGLRPVRHTPGSEVH